MPDDQVAIPALLRAARGTYGDAIRAALAEAGFDDVPRNGAFVLGGMGNRGAAAADLVHQLGVSKQATSQLIDTLVVRGYLERVVDPADRRRMQILLTERGRSAAAAVRRGVQAVDRRLEDRLAPDQLAGLRAGLEALAGIGRPDPGA